MNGFIVKNKWSVERMELLLISDNYRKKINKKCINKIRIKIKIKFGRTWENKK